MRFLHQQHPKLPGDHVWCLQSVELLLLEELGHLLLLPSGWEFEAE
jgi:hypothetical protein